MSHVSMDGRADVEEKGGRGFGAQVSVWEGREALRLRNKDVQWPGEQGVGGGRQR